VYTTLVTRLVCVCKIANKDNFAKGLIFIMSISFIKKLQYFKDLATSLRQGIVKTDRRVQVKMPSKVVEELDRQFPNADRSQIITQLAVDVIYQRLRFADRPLLRDIASSEQSNLDEMWLYLEERDAA
jgi:hypothetical protein